MKRFYVVLMVLVMVIVSCSKEEKQSLRVTQNDMVGTWNLTSLYTDKGYVSGTIHGQSFKTSVSLKAKDFIDTKAIFTITPNRVSYSGTFTLLTEVDIPGQSPYLEEKKIVADPKIKEEWIVSGNAITLKPSFTGFKNEVEGQIVVYEKDFLKIKVVISDDFSIPESVLQQMPVPIDNPKIDIVMYITYKR